MLNRELGTRLTGRYVPLPTIGRMTTVETAQLRKALDDYIQLGGIPDALKYPEMPSLPTLYDDVLYRDIATRYHIEAISALKELAFTAQGLRVFIDKHNLGRV